MRRRKPTRRVQLGVTLEDYQRLLTAQGGVCAICGRPPREGGRRLDVDHDHRTGAVRGLLDHRCNRGLGYFGDDPRRLEAAARYLRKYEDEVAA